MKVVNIRQVCCGVKVRAVSKRDTDIILVDILLTENQAKEMILALMCSVENQEGEPQ